MKTLVLLTTLFATAALAQTPAEPGPFARIAILRPLDGKSVELEAGYIRHLEWHRQAKDPFRWYGWTVWAADERQRWLIYATFGHTAESLSNPVSPAEDEGDNVLNVLPHAQFLGNAVYEFLPALSQGNGVPSPVPRAEYTVVELRPGEGKLFEAAIASERSTLQAETLWYRMVAGGTAPRYVRLRPHASLAALLERRGGQALPERANALIEKMTVEILALRPNMLVNVTPATP